MPLKFTPERAIYDAERQMVRFLARDESHLVPCAVTGRALAAAALAYSLEKSDPLLVYRTFKAVFGRRRRRSIVSASWRKMASS